MARLDRQVFLVHYEMARQVGGDGRREQGASNFVICAAAGGVCQVGGDARRELQERYRFHLAVQEIHGRLWAHDQQVRATLSRLSGKRELTRDEFQGVLAVLGQAHDALADGLMAAGRLPLPALKNVTPGAPLGPMLRTGPLVTGFARANTLDGELIGRFLEQLGEVIDKAQRIQLKSLGGILALQERLAEQWSSPGHRLAQTAEVGSPLPGQ
jgi:hypothetical protein